MIFKISKGDLKIISTFPVLVASESIQAQRADLKQQMGMKFSRGKRVKKKRIPRTPIFKRCLKYKGQSLQSSERE